MTEVLHLDLDLEMVMGLCLGFGFLALVGSAKVKDWPKLINKTKDFKE